MMPFYRMLILFVLAGWFYTAGAQQSGSVHIQSENNQLFYIQWNGEMIYSSGSGYLAIPKMPVGEQTILIGFPKKQFPDYSFQCVITEKPQGFSLKLAVDNSWSLFDMVNFKTIKGGLVTPEVRALLKPVTGNGERGNLVSAVLTDTAGTKNDTGIYKIFDQTTEAGIDQIYVVNNDGKMDTVMVLISVSPENGTAALHRKPVLPGIPGRKNNTIILGKEVLTSAIITKTAIAAISSK
jgi:hypothetical protein